MVLLTRIIVRWTLGEIEMLEQLVFDALPLEGNSIEIMLRMLCVILVQSSLTSSSFHLSDEDGVLPDYL